MTGALVVFEPKYVERMFCVFKKGEINMIPEEFISNLTEDGFLIEASFDEHKKINDLVQRRINWTKSWHFSIMLNQSCNFKCFYCFQPKKKLFITPAVEEKIIKMIKLQCKKTDRISIMHGRMPYASILEKQKIVQRIQLRSRSICKNLASKRNKHGQCQRLKVHEASFNEGKKGGDDNETHSERNKKRSFRSRMQRRLLSRAVATLN